MTAIPFALPGALAVLLFVLICRRKGATVRAWQVATVPLLFGAGFTLRFEKGEAIITDILTSLGSGLFFIVSLLFAVWLGRKAERPGWSDGASMITMALLLLAKRATG